MDVIAATTGGRLTIGAKQRFELFEKIGFRAEVADAALAALTFSRWKMASKVCLTVVVPAPEEPVTAMMGCFSDMKGAPQPCASRPLGLQPGEYPSGGDDQDMYFLEG